MLDLSGDSIIIGSRVADDGLAVANPDARDDGFVTKAACSSIVEGYKR